MKKITALLFLSTLVLLNACSLFDKEIKKHPDLAGFTDMRLPVEQGDATYDSLLTELKKDKITTFTANGITDISLLAEVNACGAYVGNIEITGDTLKLQYLLTGDEVCTSVEMKKLRYLVSNPTGKKYIIINEAPR